MKTLSSLLKKKRKQENLRNYSDEDDLEKTYRVILILQKKRYINITRNKLKWISFIF